MIDCRRATSCDGAADCSGGLTCDETGTCAPCADNDCTIDYPVCLYIGGDNAMVSAGLPASAVEVFQGSLLVCYLAAIVLVRYRFARPAEVAA